MGNYTNIHDNSVAEAIEFRNSTHAHWTHDQFTIVTTVTITWFVTATILTVTVTPAITIRSHMITWLFPHTSPTLCIPWPMPWPWYAVLHSCGTLCQTHVPAYMHSLLRGIMTIPLLPYTFSTSIPMPHVFPSLYVTLQMFYAHLPCHTLISPDTMMSSDPTFPSI